MGTTWKDCGNAMERDLLCQMKRHEILPFSQSNARAAGGDIFLNKDLRENIRALCETRFSQLPNWTGDNVRVVESWFRWGPDSLRELLCVPRCCNTASLLIFVVVDLLVYCLVLLVVEWATNRLVPQGERTWTKDGAFILQFIAVVVLSMLMCTYMFKGLHRLYPFIEEPQAIVTFALTLYTILSVWLVQLVYNSLHGRINRPNYFIYTNTAAHDL